MKLIILDASSAYQLHVCFKYTVLLKSLIRLGYFGKQSSLLYTVADLGSFKGVSTLLKSYIFAQPEIEGPKWSSKFKLFSQQHCFLTHSIVSNKTTAILVSRCACFIRESRSDCSIRVFKLSGLKAIQKEVSVETLEPF